MINNKRHLDMMNLILTHCILHKKGVGVTLSMFKHNANDDNNTLYLDYLSVYK